MNRGSTTPAAELLKEIPLPQAARQLPLVPTSGEAETLALTAEQVKEVEPSRKDEPCIWAS